jgi:hypothetical protein
MGALIVFHIVITAHMAFNSPRYFDFEVRILSLGEGSLSRVPGPRVHLDRLKYLINVALTPVSTPYRRG